LSGGYYYESGNMVNICGFSNYLIVEKVLANFGYDYIFAVLSRKKYAKATALNAALVNRLRRVPFTDE
jgi:hypothetical protein